MGIHRQAVLKAHSGDQPTALRRRWTRSALRRLSTDGGGADWPLTRKFGCSPAEAEVMLLEAADQGLGIGVSFHVGSQQRDPSAWRAPLVVVADLAASLAMVRVVPSVISIRSSTIARGTPRHGAVSQCQTLVW